MGCSKRPKSLHPPSLMACSCQTLTAMQLSKRMSQLNSGNLSKILMVVSSPPDGVLKNDAGCQTSFSKDLVAIFHRLAALFTSLQCGDINHGSDATGQRVALGPHANFQKDPKQASDSRLPHHTLCFAMTSPT